VRHIVALRRRPGRRHRRAVLRRIRGGYENGAESRSRASSAHRNGKCRVSAYPEKHPDSAKCRADIDMLKAKVDARRGPRHHAVFLRERTLFPLPRSRTRSAASMCRDPGILPVQNFKQAKNFASGTGASVAALAAPSGSRASMTISPPAS